MKLAELNTLLARDHHFGEVGVDYDYHVPNFNRIRIVQVDYNQASEYFSVLVRNLNTGIPTRYREIDNPESNVGMRLWAEANDPFLDKEGRAFVENDDTTRFQIRGIEFDIIDVT